MEKIGEFKGLPWYAEPDRAPADQCLECGRLKKTYARRISGVMARALLGLHALHGKRPADRFFHIKEVHRDRGDFAKMKFWGLLEEGDNPDPKKRTSGLWRMSEFGHRFCLRKELVPKYALVRWGSTLVGFAGPGVDVVSCLTSSGFDYDTLMGPELDKAAQTFLDGFIKSSA